MADSSEEGVLGEREAMARQAEGNPTSSTLHKDERQRDCMRSCHRGLQPDRTLGVTAVYQRCGSVISVVLRLTDGCSDSVIVPGRTVPYPAKLPYSGYVEQPY